MGRGEGGSGLPCGPSTVSGRKRGEGPGQGLQPARRPGFCKVSTSEVGELELHSGHSWLASVEEGAGTVL